MPVVRSLGTLRAIPNVLLLAIANKHEPFEEVQVGENSLKLCAYGRDLFDEMLEAIDAAQQSIYTATPPLAS